MSYGKFVIMFCLLACTLTHAQDEDDDYDDFTNIVASESGPATGPTELDVAGVAPASAPGVSDDSTLASLELPEIPEADESEETIDNEEDVVGSVGAEDDLDVAPTDDELDLDGASYLNTKALTFVAICATGLMTLALL